MFTSPSVSSEVNWGISLPTERKGTGSNIVHEFSEEEQPTGLERWLL